MKIFTLTALTFLGLTQAQLPQAPMPILKLTYRDTPMQSSSFAPLMKNCSIARPPKSLAAFKKRMDRGHLHGPCRFSMKRTLRGDLKEYVLHDEQDMTLTKFAFRIKTAVGIATYISAIYLEQGDRGYGCSAFRLSPLHEKETAEPRYTTSMEAKRDSFPRWIPSHNYQIEGGKFLLEVSSTCLNNPTALVIKLVFTYEDAARQLIPIEGSGAFIQMSKRCESSHPSKRFNLPREYRPLVVSMPRFCRFRFERDYSWVVPASHVYSRAGKKTIVAQAALYEPMLGDERRYLLEVSLGHLSGPSCPRISAFAMPKASYEAQPLDRALMSFENGFFRVEFFRGIDDRTSNFHFELPQGCEILNPIVQMRYADANTDIPPPQGEIGQSY